MEVQPNAISPEVEFPAEDHTAAKCGSNFGGGNSYLFFSWFEGRPGNHAGPLLADVFRVRDFFSPGERILHA